jgi:hypothetical protein
MGEERNVQAWRFTSMEEISSLLYSSSSCRRRPTKKLGGPYRGPRLQHVCPLITRGMGEQGLIFQLFQLQRLIVKNIFPRSPFRKCGGVSGVSRPVGKRHFSKSELLGTSVVVI